MKVVKVQNLLRKSIAELSDINARGSEFFYHNSSLFCSVSETKIKDHFVLHTNVPQISGKYDLRNHFWPLESVFFSLGTVRKGPSITFWP